MGLIDEVNGKDMGHPSLAVVLGIWLQTWLPPRKMPLEIDVENYASKNGSSRK